jgi:5'-nucleotidase
MGLAEKEWLESMATFEISHVNYERFTDCAARYVKYFREEQDCDFVIALTHIRTNNDKKLAESVEGIDLILGGHDHTTVEIIINETLIKKSGTDFREFTLLTLEKRPKSEEEFCYNQFYQVATQFKKIDITKEFEPDAELAVIV